MKLGSLAFLGPERDKQSPPILGGVRGGHSKSDTPGSLLIQEETCFSITSNREHEFVHLY